MRLRGITTKRNTIEFGINDVPVILNEKFMVLANRKKSPIILTKSVARGDDSGVLFETDFVIHRADSKVSGLVVYNDGFYIWNVQTMALIPIRDVEEFEFVPNTQLYKVDELSAYRSKIRFGSAERRFNLEKVIYFRGEELFITIKPSGKAIRLDSVLNGTGVNVERQELLYGQIVPNGKVIMYQYHPMLQLFDGTVRELEESDYDELGAAWHT